MGKASVVLIVTTIVMRSQACVVHWVDGQTNYWPSSQIPVCFVSADGPLHAAEQDMFDRAKRIITETYQKLNLEIPYQFSGFQNCVQEAQPSPKISVRLMASDGLGLSESVGPSSSQTVPNVHITYGVHASKTSNGTLRPIVEKNLAYITLHETMHLLGIHHEYHRNDKVLKDPAKHMVVLGPYDNLSVMGLDEEMYFFTNNIEVQSEFPFLSQEDRRCIDFISSHPTTITPYLE